MPTTIKCVVIPDNPEKPGETLNPTTGCIPRFPGCKLCYAQHIAASLVNRFGSEKYKEVVDLETKHWNGEVRFFPEVLQQPRRRKNPCSYFLGDMSDIWYEKVEDAWLEQIFQMVYECDRHIFLTLTKYPERMLKWLKKTGLFNSPKKHIWWGTSVENQQWADIRMPIISQLTEAGHNTFISVQPQLSKINFNLAETPILWAVFGGESKPFGAIEEARPCHIRWIEDGLEQCENAGFKVARFVEQLGTFCVTDTWDAEFCTQLTESELSRVRGIEPPALYRYQIKGNHKGGGSLEDLPKHLQFREIPYVVSKYSASN
jgi:protein gp37